MVLVMRSDGSLSASTPQTGFARSYTDGIGQGSTGTKLTILDRRRTGAEAAMLPPVSRARPEIIAGIEDAALRYASHPGLRRAGLSVTDWRRLYRSNIEVESGYDPHARSPKGAIGLGQLMPGTAADLRVNPHDWRQNLDGSARYLAALLDTFGDARLALAAYNAGPGAVERHGGVPPFPETRTHVRRVLSVFNRLEGERS